MRTHRDALIEAIAWISQSDHVEAMLERIVDSSIQVTQAERGFLIERHSNGELRVRIARERQQRPIGRGDQRFSESTVKRVLDEQQPQRLKVRNTQEADAHGSSIRDLGLRALMCVPLSTDGGATRRGVLYVDSRASARDFGDSDLQTFEALSGLVRVALDKQRSVDARIESERLLEERRIMAEIQGKLMPGAFQSRWGWEIHGWYQPAEVASGDFYDIVPLNRQRIGIAVGDVSGHGIGPALIAATAQAGLRAILRLDADLPQALSVLHQDITQRMADGHFCTLLAALLCEDGAASIVNAGHPAALLWRAADGSVESLESHHPGLGMLEEHVYDAAIEIRMHPGDVLLLVSDGITEARQRKARHEFFGEERVRALLGQQAAAGRDARAIREALIREVQAFTGGKVHDDLTVMVVQRRAEA